MCAISPEFIHVKEKERKNVHAPFPLSWLKGATLTLTLTLTAYTQAPYPRSSLGWRVVEDVVHPPYFGHNGPKTQEVANELSPRSYL